MLDLGLFFPKKYAYVYDIYHGELLNEKKTNFVRCTYDMFVIVTFKNGIIN